MRVTRQQRRKKEAIWNDPKKREQIIRAYENQMKQDVIDLQQRKRKVLRKVVKITAFVLGLITLTYFLYSIFN